MNLQIIRSTINLYKKEFLILFLFAIIYCLVSFVNHYNLRTNALDLGMFNHALYSFSHGKMNYFTLDLSGNNPIYFADHFSPITVLYSPFYYIFGSWTLLIIQIGSVLLGAWGCYKVALFKLPDFKLNKLFLVIFLAQFAIISALAFDFHNNVVAAMLVPWLFLFYFKNERGKMILVFALMLICKENIGLWLVFVMGGLMLEKGFRYFFSNFKQFLKFEIPLAIIALIYFYVVVSYIMPGLSKGEAVNQISRFGHLGDSVGEIAKNLIIHPIETLKLFFYSTSTDPLSFGIKKELHLVLFFSGGFALIFRPAYFVMLIPIYAQKLFAGDMALWGINGQYSIEFTPIICLALIDFVKIIKSPTIGKTIAISVTVMVIAVNIITIEDRKSFWYDEVTHNIFRGPHYNSGGLDLKFIHSELNKIPDKIPLSVTSCLAPHLANRDHLYHFPTVQDAKMIIVIKNKRSHYPLPDEEFNIKIKELIDSGVFKVKLDQKELLILERTTNN